MTAFFVVSYQKRTNVLEKIAIVSVVFKGL